MRANDCKILKKISTFAVILVALCLCACQNGKGEYTLYSMNLAATKLVPFSYKSQEADVCVLTGEIFDKMANVANGEDISVIPNGIKFETANLSGDVLTINLSGNINEVAATRRMLMYSALTKVMLQNENVSGLEIYINGEPAKDGSGLDMGIMRNSTFVNNAVDDPEDYKETTVTLYFANASMDKLVPVSQVVDYRSSTPIERVVVEAIIDGPSDSGVKRTVPSSLTLLGLNVREGICYVNFDAQFIGDSVNNGKIAVYSIVNSLMELPNISGVQISVEGSNDVSMPTSQLDFKTPFTYNETIVAR